MPQEYRNHWAQGRTKGEDKRPAKPAKPTAPRTPSTVKTGIWYYNHLASATGDLRAYAIFGLYCAAKYPNIQVWLIVRSGMSPFMVNLLKDCNVNMHIDDGKISDNRTIRGLDKKVITPGYGTYKTPGNLFKFQYDVMTGSGNVPVEVRELKALDIAIPYIRKGLGMVSSWLGKDTLVIHVKAKAYNSQSSTLALGTNYHEEHKLSYTLCLALALVALAKGWKVVLNDDHNRNILGPKRLTQVYDLLVAAGIDPKKIELSSASATLKFVDRSHKSMVTQYQEMAQYGTTNVRHVGGRSGHLEFMMYMGQRVYYCEEPGAQGADRIATTFGTLKYNNEILMNRCTFIPTTAGGRAEMEYRYDNTQLDLFCWLFDPAKDLNSFPRMDGDNVKSLKRIEVKSSKRSVDPYKVKALQELLAKLNIDTTQFAISP